MPKFFVKEENIQNEKIEILGEDVNHIKNVLRKNIKDKIEICNSKNGQNYICEILKNVICVVNDFLDYYIVNFFEVFSN